jgi:hypothetical protein
MDASTVDRANRLLALCARSDPGPQADAEIARLLDQRPDWTAVALRGDEEGVLPLLYWNLRNRSEFVPPRIQQMLKARFLRNAVRNARIAAELKPFFEAVKASALWVVLTKGLRLACTVYPDPGLRPFWDVDFIVRPEDWPGVREILASQGFAEAGAAGQGPGLQASEAGWAHSLYFRRGGLVLEFHFNSPGLQFPLPAAPDFWEVRPAVIGETQAFGFIPEIELCYLCLHAQQHSFARLVWLADLAEMVARGDADWARIGMICDALGIHASVYHGLRLVNVLWPGTVPESGLSRLRPSLVERFALRFFWPETGIAARKTLFPWPYDMPSLFALWERGSPALALRTLRTIFFPPRHRLALAAGVSGDSVRIYYEYLRRLARPLAVAARRIRETL